MPWPACLTKTDAVQTQPSAQAASRPPDPSAEARNGGPYVVITPVRNEVDHLPSTIASMVEQEWRPRTWVIVDDGSTDGTGRLCTEAAGTHPWIHVVSRPDRGFRKSGGGVVEAFNDGLARLAQVGPPGGKPSWDFIVKLDGDLLFDSQYFKQCLGRFRADRTLGIGGGLICSMVDGELKEESKGDPAFHVRGATKIYRRECWEAIGGLVQAPGWDTLDEVKANMLGWKTYTFPELKLQQLKPTGTADGAWKNWVKNGRANYITGYHPLFQVLKCVRRAFRKPYLVAASGLLYGFFSSYWQKTPRVEDAQLIRYVRGQQINRLLGRKSIWTSRVGV